MDEAGVVVACDVDGEAGRERELDWSRCFGGE